MLPRIIFLVTNIAQMLAAVCVLEFSVGNGGCDEAPLKKYFCLNAANVSSYVEQGMCAI